VNESNRHPLSELVDGQLQLPGSESAHGDAQRAGVDSVMDAAHADRLARALSTLRVSSAVPPRPDSLARLFDRVATERPDLMTAWEDVSTAPSIELPDLPPAVDSNDSPTLVELYDYATGDLSDAAAGHVERRMALHPESQSSLMATARLAGILSQVREATAVRPSSDAVARFLARVDARLDDELVDERNCKPSAQEAMVRIADTAVRTTPSSRRTQGTSWVSASRLVLAACLLLGASFVAWPFLTPAPAGSVLARVEYAQSIVELRAQAEPITRLLGEELLALDTVDPVALADLQLLSDTASDAHDAFDLRLARFLANSESGRIAQRLAHQAHMPAALPWEQTAWADGSTSSLDRSLRDAIRSGEFRKVEQLAAGSLRPQDRLVQLWALQAAGRTEAARGFLSDLLGTEAIEELSPAGQVFVAGACRSLGLVGEAARRLVPLADDLPALNFHLGTLLLRQLHDESRAATAFERLSRQPRYERYAEFGQSILPTRTELAARPDTLLLGSPSVSVLASEDRVFGSTDWSDYQMTVDVRLVGADDLGREPTIVLSGLRESEARQIRAVIGLDRAALVERQPISADGFATQRLTSSQFHTPLVADVWYRAKLRFSHTPDGLWVGLKLWPHGGSEPLAWQIEHTLARSTLSSGPISLAADDARVAFANLMVERFEAAE
jgi:hypothetical protein